MATQRQDTVLCPVERRCRALAYVLRPSERDDVPTPLDRSVLPGVGLLGQHHGCADAPFAAGPEGQEQAVREHRDIREGLRPDHRTVLLRQTRVRRPGAQKKTDGQGS